MIYNLHHMQYLRYDRYRRHATAVIYASTLIAWACAGAYCFDSPDEHGEIVKQALSGILCKGNLELLEKSASFSSADTEPRKHCSDNNLSKSASYIEREEKMAMNYAGDADANEKDRERALFHLGQAMHTAQDFYCRSNYIELIAEAAEAKKESVDPYTVRLIDWSSLSDDTQLASGSKELDKCTKEGEGAKRCAGTTMNSVAHTLAIRETERRWNQFEALVRRKWQTKAMAIITAFKEASCPDVDLKSLSED
jgi:hypothetical protein